MTKTKIVIVEDEANLRQTLTEVLTIKGFSVKTAVDGLAGLDLIKKSRPDIVVSDVMMPNKDGFEMLQDLKSNEQTELIPVLFLTAKAGFESRMEGLEFGADGYITKPFKVEELLVKIRNTVETRKKLIETIQREPAKIKVESQDDRFIKEVKMAIESDISNTNFGMVDLAAKLAISTSALQKKLKRICDKSVSQFIREYRLKRSRDLIELGYGNLSEISKKAGFTSLSYFSKCFKQYFGFNPTEI